MEKLIKPQVPTCTNFLFFTCYLMDLMSVKKANFDGQVTCIKVLTNIFSENCHVRPSKNGFFFMRK